MKIEYENLPAFCPRCNIQGHNSKTCRWKDGGKKVVHRKQKVGEELKEDGGKSWMPKSQEQFVKESGGALMGAYGQGLYR